MVAAMKPLYLKLHRWIALAFALPLLAVLASGLVLSFEPWAIDASIVPGSLDVARAGEMLDKHDPRGQARALVLRSYDGTLTLGTGRGGVVVDLATGEEREGASVLAQIFGLMRGLHERLLLDLGWLVIASTAAMLAISLIGILMGWPRFANTVSGWHKAMAWLPLPLIVLSPLTGLFLAFGITFTGPPPELPQAPPLKLREAVDTLGADRDLSALVWLRPQGGRYLARIVEGGEFRVYAVTRDGAVPMPRNLPRLFHEGNFAGAWSALMNVALSFAMLGLLGTGVWIWAKRRLMRRNLRRQRASLA
jgi:uncharacterized iron-regulated membrane protein